MERIKRGLNPLEIIVCPILSDSEGKISSTRIRQKLDRGLE